MMNKKKTLIAVIIAAVVLVGVLLLLLFLPKGGGDAEDGSATIDEGIKLETSTDAEGVHQASVDADSLDKIDNNSYGTLMEYVPADISTIHIENKKGTLDIVSETPEGQATVYTIKGYEGFDLQAGNPDLIATAVSSLSFSQVAGFDNGNNAADYGFDNPRSVATVTYTDGTKAIITVGYDAPQAAGTYIKFGSGNAIYLADTDIVSALDFGLTDLISLAVNDAPSDSDNGSASSITISGSGIGDTIELVPYIGEKSSASYKMVSPVECYANESESSLVEGGIRGVYADSVLMVNPSADQLSSLGLSSPYASVKAVYPDATVELLCSKPDQNGSVNLMTAGGSVVYSVAASKVPWSTTSYKALVNEYVLFPRMTALSHLNVTVSGSTTEFKLSSRSVTTTNDDGEENTSTVTTVFSGENEIQIGDFQTFYDEISLIELADADVENASGSPALRLEYTYSEDETTDTVEFYPSSGSRYIAVLNGRATGHATNADVTRAINGLAELDK